ncbi:MAG: PASTA domain-containing protein [Chitinispirillaceae bacterium]
MKKNYTISIPSKTFWTIFVPALVLFFIVGGLGGLFMVDKVIMPRVIGMNDKGEVTVPEISGMSWEQARKALYAVGLRLHVEEKQYSDDADVDMVLSQEPAPGTKVKKGRHIRTVLSKGNEIDTIPDVRRLSERGARNGLRDKGFTKLDVRKIYNSHIEKDLAVTTTPPTGTVISREVPVTLMISKGPRPTHAEVPNIVGDMLSEAKAKIQENGLAVGSIEYSKNSSSMPGTILSQSVSPGSTVPLESSINIVIASK